MASVFPIPVIVPESAARTDVPEGIPMSMPLCPDPLYTCGFAVENGVVPKYCVMQKRLPSAPDLEMHPCAKVEEYGHARTPEPTLGLVEESLLLAAVCIKLPLLRCKLATQLREFGLRSSNCSLLVGKDNTITCKSFGVLTKCA